MYAHQPPSNDAPDLILGETDFRGTRRRFGLRREDRTRHLYLLGATGSGKSNLLQYLLAQDLRAGHPVVLLDPHGDLAEAALAYTRPDRPVLIFDPGDEAFPIPWNPLRGEGSESLRVSRLVAVLHRLFADSWGPRLEHLLRACLSTVVVSERASLLLAYRFLIEPPLRERLATRARDPLLRAFWLSEFPKLPKGLQAEAVLPVTNKLGAFIANPTLRRIFGYEASRVNLAHHLDAGGVLVAALSRARLGEDVASLLGGLLLAELEAVMLSRRTPEPPVSLYLDEFQHFAGERMGSILAEARKFGLRVTMAHQFRAQLPETLAAAIRGNVGTSVYFRLGAEDAAELAPDLSPHLTDVDVTRLARHQVAVRLLADGLPLPAFTARTLRAPPAQDGPGRVQAAREASRRRFGVPKDRVDAHLARTFPGPRHTT